MPSYNKLPCRSNYNNHTSLFPFTSFLSISSESLARISRIYLINLKVRFNNKRFKMHLETNIGHLSSFLKSGTILDPVLMSNNYLIFLDLLTDPLLILHSFLIDFSSISLISTILIVFILIIHHRRWSILSIIHINNLLILSVNREYI